MSDVIPGPVPPPRRPAAVPSARRRRLRVTLVLLCTGATLAIGIGTWLKLRSRPAEYRPDERNDSITSSLAVGLPPDAPKPRLTDITRPAGLADFKNFKGNRTSQLAEDMGPGLAWGDFDNDGDDDLFLVSAGGPLDQPENALLPCALYENLGNGTFRRVEVFPELRIRGIGAAFGDYDGDGFLDLVVTGYNTLLLLHNERGTGKFVRDSRLPELKGFWTSAAWGDFDHDRRLDLYVCNYVQFVENDPDRGKLSDQIGTAVPYALNPSSYTPGLNALFHQNPDGSFTDVAAQLGVQNPTGRSLAAVWNDFDNDGWLDLYVANDVSDNVLYRNLGGTFKDISHAAWVADYRSAMGIAVGDFDRDGDDDMHLTHWVAQENALYENMTADLARVPSTNDAPAGLRFVDIADQKGVGQIALPFVGWGTEFVDLDQDGWLDLLAVNGSTLEIEGSNPRQLQPQESFAFWNRRGEAFHNLATLCPGLSEKHVSRGLACADFDNDGDMDFAIADLHEGVRLFRNDMATGHWLKLRLRNRNANGVANGFGDGSTAIVWLGKVPLRRSIIGGTSYASGSSHTLHWGLGAATTIDRLEIHWQAGGTNILTNLEADAAYEIVEGDGSGPRKLSPSRGTSSTAPTANTATTNAVATPLDARQRVKLFWDAERGAMNAMKIAHDNDTAIRLFRQALALDPKHEDSHYYLGLCLVSKGEWQAALAEFEALQQINPQSHRAWQQWGVVKAVRATNDIDLAAAEKGLQRAHDLNPEETGALLVLGEVALLRGNDRLAEERLAAACQSNSKAVGGFFLRGYMAWKRGDTNTAVQFLETTRKALGPEWKPAGTTSEGDVTAKHHDETSPLGRFWREWNGNPTPSEAFRTLANRLK